MYRRALLVDDTAIQMDYPSETMRLQYDALDGLMHITGVTVRAVQVYDAEGHRLGIDMVGARSVSLQGLAPGLYVLKVLDVMGAIHAARFVRM